MPTGYTSRIKEGYTFREFAMDCARAFGACVELRDEGGGGEVIPDKFEPTAYHLEKIATAKRDLAEVRGLSDMEAAIMANAEWDRAEADRLRRLDEIRGQRALYRSMLSEVVKWTPPTQDHAELKSFMRDQIERSIEFDCGESHYDEQKPRLSGTEWRANRIKSLTRDIEYHSREHAKDVERASGRTSWISALRASLAGNPL